MQRNLLQSPDYHGGIASVGSTPKGASEAMVFIPPLAEVPDNQANYNNKDSSGDNAHQQRRYINS